MRCVVTGAAGFIGSNLVDRLLADGHEVRGIDCFTEYYRAEYKRENLSSALHCPRFELLEADLCRADLTAACRDAEVVFHLAAEPGVRASFGEGFCRYVERNVLATHRMLEALRGATAVRRFIYASTSSVYGRAETYPCPETARPQPISPYGATKLAGEHLCLVYHHNFGLPVVSLRYFTVYGPRQRPDMAFTRFLTAALAGGELPVYGEGSQVRDFTFVGDAVEATCAAVQAPPGEVLNIGGGHPVTLNEALLEMEAAIGLRLRLRHLPAQPGDMARTAADISRAAQLMGYAPAVPLREGLRRQAQWLVGSIQYGRCEP